MTYPTTSELPEGVRKRLSDTQQERYMAVYNAIVASHAELPEQDRASYADAVAIRICAAEGDEAPESASEPYWVDAMPAGKMEVTTSKGRSIEMVPASYLKAAASELNRYYADLEARGVEGYFQPIEDSRWGGPHTDSGYRAGDIRGARWKDGQLQLKLGWLPAVAKDVDDGFIQHVSPHIIPEYTDPQTSKTYSPFILEASPTTHPKNKGANVIFPLGEQKLAELGLRLSEDHDMGQDNDSPQNDTSTPNTTSTEGTPAGEEEATIESLQSEIVDLKSMFAELINANADDDIDDEEEPEEEPALAASETTIQRIEKRMDELESENSELKDELAKARRMGNLPTTRASDSSGPPSGERAPNQETDWDNLEGEAALVAAEKELTQKLGETPADNQVVRYARYKKGDVDTLGFNLKG